MAAKTNSKEARIILGIDPGTSVLGWGVIRCIGNSIELVDVNVLNMRKTRDTYAKLAEIHRTCLELIQQYKPGELAIEAPFYGKNIQSMLKLGRAQGVAIAAAYSLGLEIFEYAPKRIKQSLTGNGNASKEQLAANLKSILKEPELDVALDATDALGAAICHFYQNGQLTQGPKHDSWAGFLASNKDRIIR